MGTGDKIATILKAAKVDCEPFWPGLFAGALKDVNVTELISTSEAESDPDPPLEALLQLVEPLPKKSWKKPRRNRPPKTLEMTIWDSVSSIKTARTLFINKLY